MFIKLTEYEQLTGNQYDDLIAEISDETKGQCLQLAIDEMTGYLAAKYDTNSIFRQQEESRNADILVNCAIIAVYRMSLTIFTEFAESINVGYDEAVAWLKNVAIGNIEPDLPYRADPELRFLTEDDYDTLILDEDKDLISNSNQANRFRAEDMAIDQMKGFLRSKYDVAATFAVVPPDNRNKVLVMYCMDITLYHLHASIPGRFVPEIRRIRYEDALAWLKDVAKGLIDPNLVLKTDPTTGDTITGPSIIFGSNAKQDNSW